MEFALKAENVSIRYITGDFKDIGIKEYLTRKATHNYHVNEFMAVDGVSFTLERGDMLGIVGTNGAGKSTLLKAVSGIMEPTKGKITANGEVAALLELGSGFDGDLTVRENAYLRGAMLGYTKEFMDETYDQIIDFAELRPFEDRPFKQLSSGMKSRLAFSIASLVKPDILILDEVLSVGDGAFQEKSAKKMKEIISQGATTILVSHSLDQIRELCNKVLWLDHGRQIAFGNVTEICNLYEQYLNGEISIESCIQEQYEKPPQEANPYLPTAENSTGEPARAVNPGIARSKSIDGIRGIASIVIAMFHFGQLYPVANLFHGGWWAVELFFVISGFLLVASAIRQGTHFSPYLELKKRLKRMYPAYLLGIAALIMLYSIVWYDGNPVYWLDSNPAYPWAALVEILGLQTTGWSDFVYINGPAWYVSSLWIVVVVLAVLYKLFRSGIYIIAAICSLLIYGIMFLYMPSMPTTAFAMGTRIPVPLLRALAGMCLGVFIYRIYTSTKAKEVCQKIKHAKALNTICSILLFVLLIFFQTSRASFLLLLLISGILLLYFEGVPSYLDVILQSRFVQYIGKISFSFYIMQSFSQNFVQICVSRFITNNIALNICYFLINFIVGSVCYYVFENKLPSWLAKHKTWPSAMGRAAIVAAFFTFIIFLIGTNITIRGIAGKQAQDTSILIYSETPSENVTYRGAEVDGTWISPWDNVPDYGNWVFDEGQATYTATDDSPLTVDLPQGQVRTITFNVGPHAGSVRVEMNGETLRFDLKQSETVELGLPFVLPEDHTTSGSGVSRYIPAVISFAVFFLVCCALGRKNTRQEDSVRELWGDLLRIICCFVIILLHNTCNTFEQFWQGEAAPLLINAFTAFAVPCFYMISGAYLLRKPQGITGTLKHRIPKIVIPTLFWGCVYLLLAGQTDRMSFLKLIFQNQESHLWFMYSLLGIYMLLPFISKLYNSISTTQKIYGLLLLLVIPTCIYDGSKLMGIWVPNPSFAVFWPDLGIFLLGGVLWDQRERIKMIPRGLYILFFFAGLGITALGTVYISNINAIADKSLISAIGSVGNLTMAASVFCFTLSCENTLQKRTSHATASLIHNIGSVTMGIYFIHIIFLRNLNNTANSLIQLYFNSGSLSDMILSACAYFVICATVCLSAKRIPVINKIF